MLRFRLSLQVPFKLYAIGYIQLARVDRTFSREAWHVSRLNKKWYAVTGALSMYGPRQTATFTLRFQTRPAANWELLLLNYQQNPDGVSDAGRSCDLTATTAHKHIDTIKKRCEDEWELRKQFVRNSCRL